MRMNLPTGRNGPSKALIVGGGVLGLAILTAFSSYYEVGQTERAGVRVMGALWSATPIQPGPHFKPPFISSVDRLQVSQTALHIKPFDVVTVDNQRITLDINLQYTIPGDGVFHLMYEVGKSGSTDIDNQVVAVVQDRASRVFSNKNTNFISGDREKIQHEVITNVADALQQQFKIHMVSLQIAKIGYSEAFTKSNEIAVLAKNEAVAEENKKKVKEYQAQQGVITAQGARDQAIASAQGLAESTRLEAEGMAKATLLKAEAEAKAKELIGTGEAQRLKLEIGALGGAPQYVTYLNARAQLNWNGTVPGQIMQLGGSTPVMLGMPFQPKQ